MNVTTTMMMATTTTMMMMTNDGDDDDGDNDDVDDDDGDDDDDNDDDDDDDHKRQVITCSFVIGSGLLALVTRCGTLPVLELFLRRCFIGGCRIGLFGVLRLVEILILLHILQQQLTNQRFCSVLLVLPFSLGDAERVESHRAALVLVCTAVMLRQGR